MTEIRLPRWLIARKMLPGGLRLFPKPRLIVTPIVTWKQFQPTQIGSDTLLDIAGNEFAGWEYRFWAAALEGDKVCVTECRCCHMIYMDRVNRRAHLRETGCSKKLVGAFKLLQADQRCVICNNRSTKEKWGVPLCDDTCIKRWTEEEAQPLALEAALELWEHREGA